MRIVTIMGSPRKKGNTYELTRKVEESMKQLGDVEFEYIFLKDLNLKTCSGCQICFNKGEELCPLKDDRVMLEEKMHNADGVIFTSPNYVFNISGLMKNFIDRFGYVCHRPRFFKNSLIIITSGVGGSGLMMKPFSLALQTWGFNVIDSIDIIKNGDPTSTLTTPPEKVNQKVEKSAKKFYNALSAGNPKTSIFSMIMFLFAKNNIKELNPEYYDYHYWKNHGWLENNANYYQDPEANFIKKGLASILSKFMGLVM
ncbi:MAG TPA: flavodoxin family protein [Methanobacterium sp.]|nr:flavodoxin family protein [Methanobacterium sp.]